MRSELLYWHFFLAKRCRKKSSRAPRTTRFDESGRRLITVRRAGNGHRPVVQASKQQNMMEV